MLLSLPTLLFYFLLNFFVFFLFFLFFLNEQTPAPVHFAWLSVSLSGPAPRLALRRASCVCFFISIVQIRIPSVPHTLLLLSTSFLGFFFFVIFVGPIFRLPPPSPANSITLARHNTVLDHPCPSLVMALSSNGRFKNRTHTPCLSYITECK